MTSALTLLAVVVLTGLDQYIKFCVRHWLKPVGTHMLIPGVIQLHYSENDGAMMGLLPGKTVLMAVLALVLLGVIFWIIFAKKLNSKFLYCAFVGIFAGGIGNIIDRLFLGYVVDYIEVLIVHFYIFNFADCLITVGAFLILFYEIRMLFLEQKQKKEQADG